MKKRLAKLLPLVLPPLFFLSSCATSELPTPPAATNNIAPAAQTGGVRWLTPRAILEDYTYPPDTCKQRFTMIGDDMAWQIDFPPHGYAYGAIALRRTNDLVLARSSGMKLVFRIRPAYAVKELRIALVDGQGVVVDARAMHPETPSGEGWANVEVPFTLFPKRGVATAPDTTQSVATFDWSAVREFRLIRAGRMPQQHVEAGMLRIEKE